MLINVDEVFCLFSASQHQCKWHWSVMADCKCDHSFFCSSYNL